VTEEGGRPGGGLGRLDWTVDVPLEEERAARRRVTGAIVRIAESIGSPGDIYHVVSRSPVESETDLRAIGPMLQALGDRLHTFLGREVLQGRTSVWPVLPRGVHLAEYVEAVRYDPDAPGEPGGLLAELPCRWAFAVAWRRERASVIYRVALWVPTEVAATVRAVLESS